MFRHMWDVRYYVFAFFIGLMLPTVIYTILIWFFTLIAMFLLWELPDKWYVPYTMGTITIESVERLWLLAGVGLGIYFMVEYNKSYK